MPVQRGDGVETLRQLRRTPDGEQLRWCDRQVGQHVRSSPAARRAAQIDGIGELGASAFTASLGRITKRGDEYLRTLLIQGAKSAVMSAGKRDDPISRWLVQLTARVGWQKACVAMANKNARILWSVMTREQGYDAHHVSVKLPAKQATVSEAAPATPSEQLCAA